VRTPSGSVRRLKDGRWLARIRWSDGGRRLEKSEIVSSKNAGGDRTSEWRRELQESGTIADRRGAASTPEVETFADLAAFYRERYVIPAVYQNGRKIRGMRSWKTTRSHVTLLESLIASKLLRTIRYADMADARDAMLKIETFRGTPRSIAHTQRVMSTARRMLHVARQRGWMQHDPFDQGDSLINPAHEAERQRILTPAEEKLLLSKCAADQKRAHLRTIVIVAIETGMRQGEILRLTRTDVDLQQKVINVLAMHTKTLEPRIVPITKRLAAELRRYLPAVPASWPTLFNVSTVDTAFRGACAEAGIAGLRFHDLRHTAATRMIEAGVPEALVGRILGHKVAQTTRRYVNLHLQAALDVAAMLDRRPAASNQCRTTESSAAVIPSAGIKANGNCSTSIESS
jgi:integrase